MIKTILDRVRYWLCYEMNRSHGGIQYSYFDHPEQGKRLMIRIGVNEIVFHRCYYYKPFRFSWGQWNYKKEPLWAQGDWDGWIGFGRYYIQGHLYFWRTGGWVKKVVIKDASF